MRDLFLQFGPDAVHHYSVCIHFVKWRNPLQRPCPPWLRWQVGHSPTTVVSDWVGTPTNKMRPPPFWQFSAVSQPNIQLPWPAPHLEWCDPRGTFCVRRPHVWMQRADTTSALLCDHRICLARTSCATVSTWQSACVGPCATMCAEHISLEPEPIVSLLIECCDWLHIYCEQYKYMK